MFKAKASQNIGAQMVSATDGSAFTGAVTVRLTKDGGTQALGNVGSGACASEGNGYHSYVADATDTNADHIAFTFTGTGAVPVTIQVYTQDKLAADMLTLSAKTMGYGVVGSGSTPTSIVLASVNFAGKTTVAANALAGRRCYPVNDLLQAGSADAVGNGGRITANTSGTAPTLTINSSDQFTDSLVSGDVVAIV